ncbi:MAG TPA: shikimate kinase [Thermoplasmata archaeon]|nr:shikimate kinase [Thermoplasmata archaeon]
MKGIARTFGAITITNALSAGIGCATGVELPVRAEVSITVDGSKDPPKIDVPSKDSSPVVEGSLRAALARYHPTPGTVARLSLRSEIPVARGLKSSSAVSTAVVLAVARAAGEQPSALEIGRQAAEVARRIGISATGAFDDALAGLEPGFIVTDNRRDEVLRRTSVDPDWGVVLYIPTHDHPPSPSVVRQFAQERPSGELAARAAMDGDWVRAMTVNTELVERTMRYSYQELRQRLQSRGAIASGVSGLGPALATIAPIALLPELVEILPNDGAEKRVVSFTRSATAEVALS